MAEVSRSAGIAAPASRVLAVVTDVAAYPSLQRDVASADVQEVDGDGRPLVARIAIAAMGYRGAYTVRFDYPVDDDPGVHTVRYRMTEGDLMTRNDATFTVVDRGADRCELTVAVDLALAFPMPRLVLDRLAAKGVRELLTGVRTRAERR